MVAKDNGDPAAASAEMAARDPRGAMETKVAMDAMLGGRLVATFVRVAAASTLGSWTTPLARAAWRRTTTACGALSAPLAWGPRLPMSSAVGCDTPKEA
jgi:hypothetical protein